MSMPGSDRGCGRVEARRVSCHRGCGKLEARRQGVCTPHRSEVLAAPVQIGVGPQVPQRSENGVISQCLTSDGAFSQTVRQFFCRQTVPEFRSNLSRPFMSHCAFLFSSLRWKLPNRDTMSSANFEKEAFVAAAPISARGHSR